LTYQLLFKLLQSSAQERKLKFSPARLMTDFETAVKSTFTTLVSIVLLFAKGYGFCNAMFITAMTTKVTLFFLFFLVS